MSALPEILVPGKAGRGEAAILILGFC